MTTAFVSHSGGLDSTAALLLAVEKHGAQNVVAVGIDYGQRHGRSELSAATTIRDMMGVRSATLDLKGMVKGSSLLGEGDVPHGHYAEESMSATVVSGRNLMFVSGLVGMAQAGDEVWLGVHGGDHFIYPDCRPSFAGPLGEAIAAAYDITLVTPFIEGDKTTVASTFGSGDARLIATTWSCYEGGEMHCGRCGTCVERLEAFELANVLDFTDYEDPNYWREVVAAR